METQKILEYAKWANIELAEKYLSEFIKQAWALSEPKGYIQNWHIDFMCEYFEAVSGGEVRRLIITVPPRHMKSLSSAVFWPAWDWIETPQRRFVFSSYSHALSVRDTTKSRRLIQSNWYQNRWSDKFNLTSDQNTKIRYDNNKNGFRIATSVDGLSTGEGGDIIVIDDPHNVRESLSDIKRNSVIDWWDDAMSTRLDDPKTGAYIIVMQRVHDQDLVGHVLSKNNNWDHLCLPARYEKKHPTPLKSTIGIKDPRKEEGELLFPGRFGENEQLAIESNQSDYGVAGQQQQRPSVKGGGIVKDKWWKYYDDLPYWDRRVIYVDTAQKVKEVNDYSVFQCWAHSEKGIYLLDQVRGKFEYPELKNTAIEFYRKHKKGIRGRCGASVMKVEDKVSGTSLIQDLAINSNINIQGIPRPSGSGKPQRMLDYCSFVQNGHCYLPSVSTELTDAEWVSDFKSEWRKFRLDMTHIQDDQIDPALDAIADMLAFDESMGIAALSM